MIASTIDFVLAGRDRLNAKIGSEGIAHGLRALGTVLTVASASGDARVGTRIADLLLESAGSFLVADPEGAGVFLRRCEWGKVADLAGDPSAQMRILDELVHGDEPRVAAATSAARRES